MRAEAPSLGPGALGLSREEVRGDRGEGEDVTEPRAQEARGGRLETGVQRRAGWTATTLGLGCVEAEKS